MQSKTGGGDINSTVHDRLNNLNIQKVLRNQSKIYASTKNCAQATSHKIITTNEKVFNLTIKQNDANEGYQH